MKKILCPIDFSTASQAAMRTAERLATALGGEMVLLHATGLVDDDTVARLWAALARAGKADSVRSALLETVAVRR